MVTCGWLFVCSLGKGGFGKVNAIQRRSNQELMALKRMSKAEVRRATGTTGQWDAHI